MDMVGIPDWKMNFQCGKSADRAFFQIASAETGNEMKKMKWKPDCGEGAETWIMNGTKRIGPGGGLKKRKSRNFAIFSERNFKNPFHE